MNKILLVFTCSVVLLVANEGGQVDFFPRTVNFIIFAAFMYYILNKPVRDFFESRSKGIEDSFEKIQEKIKEIKRDKDNASRLLEDSKIKSLEIIEAANEELVIMEERLKEKLELELIALHKQKEEAKAVARNKMSREVVYETLKDVFDSKDLDVDGEVILETLIKKVA